MGHFTSVQCFLSGFVNLFQYLCICNCGWVGTGEYLRDYAETEKRERGLKLGSGKWEEDLGLGLGRRCRLRRRVSILCVLQRAGNCDLGIQKRPLNSVASFLWATNQIYAYRTVCKISTTFQLSQLFSKL